MDNAQPEKDPIEQALFRFKWTMNELLHNRQFNPITFAILHREADTAYHSYRQKQGKPLTQ